MLYISETMSISTSGVIYIFAINDPLFDDISIDRLFVFKIGISNVGVPLNEYDKKSILCYNKGVLNNNVGGSRLISRLNSVQTGCAFLLDILDSFYIKDGVRNIEKAIHCKLSSNKRINSLCGEWFMCKMVDADDIVDLIKNTINDF